MIQENPSGNLLSRSIATSPPLAEERNSASRRRSRSPSSKTGASADAAPCSSPTVTTSLGCGFCAERQFHLINYHIISTQSTVGTPRVGILNRYSRAARETAGRDGVDYGKVVYERGKDHRRDHLASHRRRGAIRPRAAWTEEMREGLHRIRSAANAYEPVGRSVPFYLTTLAASEESVGARRRRSSNRPFAPSFNPETQRSFRWS